MKDVQSNRPLVCNIRHFALDDGPGIRTTVFFKGCPLSCTWCHNPESMSAEREIAFHPELCIQCGDCLAGCQDGAIRLQDGERIIRERCSRCGQCVEVCPARALRSIGTYYSVDECADFLLKDRLFYETSDGGVTFSGGEPTLHMDFLSAVMKILKKSSIHIAIQTSGMFDLSGFQAKLLPYCDLIFYDIKFYDAGSHRQYTGADNSTILDNFVYLVRHSDAEIIPRVPLVPGITDTEDNLTKIAHFLKTTGCNEYELLPYNPGGISKRRATGRPVPGMLPDRMLDIEEEKRLNTYFQTCRGRF
jgi:pyruvate formate lyase activating enzyme